MKNKFFYVFLISTITSCATYKNIDIQYFNNPELEFPDCSQGVVILANHGLKHTQSKRLMYEWALDSVATAEATYELQNLMLESPLFSNYSIVTDIHQRTDTSNVVLPLRWEVLNDISARNGNANIIISLEYMKVTPKHDCYQTAQGEFMNYYGYLDIDVYYYWRVYNLSTQKTSNKMLNRDTLHWDKTDWVEVRPGNQLPGVFKATAYAGIDAAKQYSSPFIPTWLNGSRLIYYKGSKIMEDAYQMALSGEWMNAAALWQKVISSNDKKNAAKAAFNLALASEMLDKFDIAMQWLIKSYEMKPSLEGIHEYQHILENRIEANK